MEHLGVPLYIVLETDGRNKMPGCVITGTDRILIHMHGLLKQWLMLIFKPRAKCPNELQEERE
jgi:hypothetical protein